MLLQNKNIIITGCNRGIGEKIVELFAQNGANIWACSRSPSSKFEAYLKKLEILNNTSIWPIYFDLGDQKQIKIAVKNIMTYKKQVNGLVNNAGITYNALFQMSTVEKMKEVFEINYFSQIIFSQFVAKLMLRNKSGSIVNISSTAGLDGNSGRSIYGASKAAMICTTKSMAKELGEKGIRVNSIAPGITETDMLGSMSDEIIKETINQTHCKRLGQPIDIANACLFLASDLSSYITGQVIRVDGGLG